MDHFERELARMMRDTEQHTPFEPAQRDRLMTGVRARRRIRSAQKAVGSVLAVAGLSVGLFLLPHAPKGDRPQSPLPMTGRSSADVSPTMTPSPSGTPTGSDTTAPDDTPSTSSTPTAPSSTSGSTSAGADPSRTATSSAPPGASSTPSGSITPPPPSPPTSPTTVESPSFSDATESG